MVRRVLRAMVGLPDQGEGTGRLDRHVGGGRRGNRHLWARGAYRVADSAKAGGDHRGDPNGDLGPGGTHPRGSTGDRRVLEPESRGEETPGYQLRPCGSLADYADALGVGPTGAARYCHWRLRRIADGLSVT